MNCEICETRFDHDEHKPYCIIPCTHSYCITCLNRLIRKKCPKCDTLIQSKNPNWSLIGLIGIDSIPTSTKNESHDSKSKTFETPLRTPIIDEASYYFNRGLEMFYQKEYKQSVEAYENAIKFSNGNVNIYVLDILLTEVHILIKKKVFRDFFHFTVLNVQKKSSVIIFSGKMLISAVLSRKKTQFKEITFL